MRAANTSRKIDCVRFSVCGLFVMGIIATLYVSRSILLPVILSLILAQILRPLYGFFHRSLRLPASATAFVIVITVTTALVAGGYFLSGPAATYQEKLGDQKVQQRLKETFYPIKKIHTEIVDVAQKVDTIAEEPPKEDPESDGNKQSDPDEEKDADGKEDAHEDPVENSPGFPTKKEVEEEDTAVSIDSNPDDGELTTTVTTPIKREKSSGTVNVQIKENSVSVFYSVIQDLGFHLFTTIVLLYFFLAHGEDMSTRLGEARGAPELLLEIEREVSGYLLSITMINLALGAAIGIALGVLGVPNPVLWGVMAALLNFIPYAGALLGAGVVILIAAMEFSNPGTPLAAGGIYLGLSAIEGNFVTPSLVGRRFEINPIIVFIWVMVWAAIWGLAGMLIALPILIIFRIVCSKIPSLVGLERAITITPQS